jgi:hypothetical protein
VNTCPPAAVKVMGDTVATPNDDDDGVVAAGTNTMFTGCVSSALRLTVMGTRHSPTTNRTVVTGSLSSSNAVGLGGDCSVGVWELSSIVMRGRFVNWPYPTNTGNTHTQTRLTHTRH